MNFFFTKISEAIQSTNPTNSTQQLTGYLSQTSANGFVGFWEKYIKTFAYALVSSSESSLPNDKLIIQITNSTNYIKLNKNYEFGSVYAVQDSNPKSEFRYLVIYSFDCGYTNNCLTGVFVYFNSSGSTVKIQPIKSVLCSYDMRNGRVLTKLYDQTLIFSQIHRDTKTEICFLSLFDIHDNLVGTTEIFTEIKGNWIKYSNNEQKSDKFPPKYYLLGTDNWVDLSSLGKTEGKYNPELAVQVYKSSNPSELDTSSKPNSAYTDGYPNSCVICSGPTSVGMFGSKNMLMNLGSGFCVKCEIRYSVSDGVWKCCKVIESHNKLWDDLCCNCVSENLPCVNPAHSTTQNLECVFEGIELKYPFKKRYGVTICEVK